MLWPGLVSWVGALHRDNLIAPFPLGQSCPRKIAMTMTIVNTVTRHFQILPRNFSGEPYLSILYTCIIKPLVEQVVPNVGMNVV